MRTRLARWFGDVLYDTYPCWSVALAYLSLALLILTALFQRQVEGQHGITFVEPDRRAQQ
jgi:hypothetical protein